MSLLGRTLGCLKPYTGYIIISSFSAGIHALMAGLFSNFQEIYSFKEESEKHRIAHLRFMAFFREISCIVTTAPKYRATSADFITMKRLEFDKILEQSPDIPQCIITAFNHTFRNLSIHKPDAVIGLQTIIPYGKQLKLQPYCRSRPDLVILKISCCYAR